MTRHYLSTFVSLMKTQKQPIFTSSHGFQGRGSSGKKALLEVHKFIIWFAAFSVSIACQDAKIKNRRRSIRVDCQFNFDCIIGQSIIHRLQKWSRSSLCNSHYHKKHEKKSRTLPFSVFLTVKIRNSLAHLSICPRIT